MTIHKAHAAVTAAALSIALSLSSCGGGGGSAEIRPLGPTVAGPARYVDSDRDGAIGAGDRLIVPFTADVQLDRAAPGDFVLPVDQDSLGAATVEAGPAPNEVSIVLGAGASLRTRGRFDPATTGQNAPSGIDVDPGQTAIRSADGVPAGPAAGGGTDIAPVFAAGPASVTAFGVLDVATGDLDRDGNADLVAVTADGIRVSKGDGAFGFGAPELTAAQGIRGVAVADLNRFTNDEVVTFHATFTQVWNNTAGALVQGQQLASGDTVQGVLADFDGNGKPDVATAGNAGVSVFLHLGNLGNSFDAPRQVVLPQASAIAAADVDRDGDVDLLVGRAGAPGRVLLNDGTGNFTDGGSLGVAGILDLAVADIDGDGDLDALAARGGESTVLLTNDGRGAFTATDVAVPAVSVLLDDVDGDARADAVLATQGATTLWMNDRAGSFLRAADLDAAGAAALAGADFDADGDDDLAVATPTGIELRSASRIGTQGTTTFQSAAQLGNETSRAVAMGDVDGDGDLDQVVANLGGNQVWLNDGAGNFSFSGEGFHILGAGDSRAVVLGDLDGDGDLDAVIGNTSANGGAANEVYENDGAGRFQVVLTFAAGTKTLSLALTRFDADTKLDIVVGNDGRNQVFRNESTNGVIAFTEVAGPFSLGNNAQLDRQTIALFAFDMDTDGDEDLVEINGGTEASPQDTQVWRKANALFSLRLRLFVGRLAMSGALGDFDGDGILDLATGHKVDGGRLTVQLYRGQRTQLSTLPIQVDTGSEVQPRGLALRDIDGDGKADLVLANDGAPSQVLRGDGKGAFTALQTLETDAVTGLAVADIDADGDLDLVVTVSGGANRVYANR